MKTLWPITFLNTRHVRTWHRWQENTKKRHSTTLVGRIHKLTILMKLADRLLRRSWSARASLRSMEPPLDPPDDGPELECPECNGPMHDVKKGGSDKWDWHFVCDDEQCGGEIRGDKLP